MDRSPEKSASITVTIQPSRLADGEFFSSLLERISASRPGGQWPSHLAYPLTSGAEQDNQALSGGQPLIRVKRWVGFSRPKH
jgi:hypothetical protein